MTTETLPQAAAVQPQTVKVLVGIPTGGKVIETSAFLNWLTLVQQWGHDGVAVIGTTDGPVAMVREWLCRKFMEEKEFTHLLMLDTDHQHPKDILERLSRWVGQAPYPLVISGLNYQRKEPYRPAAFMFDGPTLGLLPLLRWPTGLVQVDAVGAASLLVAREVFERIPGPWWEFVYHGEGDATQRRLIGEDINFCRRCKDAGISVYVDTTTTSPHLGEMWVSDAQYRAWVAGNAESLGPERQVDTQALIQGKPEEDNHKEETPCPE